jgi:succinate dehydrogenase / fumarate reductase cytochrome b subunit
LSSLLAPERSTHATPVAAEQSTVARGSFAPDAARWLLAASGFLMLAFVSAHLVGNLLAFGSAGAFNDYAHSLRQLGTPLLPESGVLWAARVALAGALVVHLGSHLYIMTHPDGPSAITVGPSDALPPWYATLPVAVFQVSGALMVAFLAFHLAQLTFGVIHPAFVAGDPYDNTIVALRFWPVSAAYVCAAVAVGVHLLPGTWTGLRSLGLIRTSTVRLAGIVAPTLAVTVAVGLSSVPVAVLIGILK